MTILPQADEWRRAQALHALDPRRWGCEVVAGGWRVTLPAVGEVCLARLGWEHAQTPAGPAAEEPPGGALGLLVNLQAAVWGMPPEETVPTNLLAVLGATGGSVLAAYRSAAGWTAEGWLGFAIAAGGRDGLLVSHMLGVRAEVRGGAGLGWLLKAIQGWEAVRTGHRAAAWTFDPMRGASARLNIEKLGATCTTLTLDKYGPLRSRLYGDVPSDRLTARWDLLSPAVATRLAAVHAGHHVSPDAAALDALPEPTMETVAQLAEAPAVRYELPGDVDELTARDPARAVAWRHEMRAVLGRLLDTERAVVGAPGDPLATTIEHRPGRYAITGFASVPTGTNRRNAYILERRPEAAVESSP